MDVIFCFCIFSSKGVAIGCAGSITLVSTLTPGKSKPVCCLASVSISTFGSFASSLCVLLIWSCTKARRVSVCLTLDAKTFCVSLTAFIFAGIFANKAFNIFLFSAFGFCFALVIAVFTFFISFFKLLSSFSASTSST